MLETEDTLMDDQDKKIPRRRFLVNAAATTAAAVALSPTNTRAAESQVAEAASASAAPAAAPASTAAGVDQFVVLHQIVKAGRERANAKGWNYLIGAADTETTMRRNRMALDSIAFKPRVLRGVGKVDLAGELLGQKTRIPVLLAGMGSVALLDPGGAATVARAGHRFGVPIGVSSEAKPGMEEAAAAAPGLKIYQLYVRGDDAWIDNVAQRVVKAGYTALAFTVDSAAFSRRERDIVTGGQNATRSDNPDPYLAGLNWDIVTRFKQRHPDLPVIIKGITTGEDADLACQAGVSAVWVSTHGGRQLDFGRGAMDILPEVVQAVHGRAQIIVDSGFCRGSDVVKAIAAGANAVGIGKLQGYALAAGGEDGVVRMLEILEREIYACMANLGVSKLSQLNTSYTAPALPVNLPSLFSAFPLIDTV
jgi:isopentenyl diphosphate isomerase/L-lactate dehydrogenase-like FMN-dependent dehydrogenase